MHEKLLGLENKALLTWKDTCKVNNPFRRYEVLTEITSQVLWQRDNEFVLISYRQASFLYSNSIWSIFAHKETANIWSHLLGPLWFIANTVDRLKQTNSPSPRAQDIFFVTLYQLCVSVCFVLSAFYHPFSNHSPGLHKVGNELDHLGIVLVMWGTGMSGVHFTLYFLQALRNTYFVFLASTALGCAVFTMRPEFRRPEYRTTRFLMYCFLGASLFAPVIHGLLRFGPELQPMMGLASFLALALINYSGAAVYAAIIPERWYPGVFDLLRQSHNWMHVLVLTGALVRLKGLHDTLGVWQMSTEKYGLCENMI